MRPANGKPQRVALDCDVHAAVVYGKQEEAAFGYPHSRDGHRQYNIRAAMLGNCGELVDSELLAGNAHSSTGAIEFLERVLRALPERIEVALYRLDAGFFSLAMLKHLEARGRRYLIGLPLYRSLRARVMTLPQSAWKRVTPGQEVAELQVPFGRRGIQRRMIVARNLEPKQPTGEQSCLEGLEPGPHYHYFALVTNIDKHSPKKLWQSYGRRASIEALFREAKLGFGLDRLPSAKHVANEAYIKLVFLAYNLVHWFRRHVLQGAWAKARINALRDWLLRIPAKVIRTTTGWVIDLPRGHPSLGALQQIQLALASV